MDWSKDRFDFIRETLGSFLQHHAGFHRNNIYYVPCSGLSGENVMKKDADLLQFSWYEGPTLVDQLDKLVVPDRPIDKPFRFSVSDVFKAGFVGGITLSGRIESGYVYLGMNLIAMPSREECHIKRKKLLLLFPINL